MHNSTKERLQRAIGKKILDPSRTDADIARELEVSPQALSNNIRDHKDFYDSEKVRLKTLCDGVSRDVDRSLREMCRKNLLELLTQRDAHVETVGEEVVDLTEKILCLWLGRDA